MCVNLVPCLKIVDYIIDKHQRKCSAAAERKKESFHSNSSNELTLVILHYFFKEIFKYEFNQEFNSKCLFFFCKSHLCHVFLYASVLTVLFYYLLVFFLLFSAHHWTKRI